MLSMSLADRHFSAGVQHQSAGESALAEACFRQAIAVWPGCAAAWANLGLLHDAAREPEPAIACYRQALALDPASYEAALNLGATLAGLKRHAEAEAAYLQAIALRPGEPAVWSNLGAMLACLRRDADAQACCCHALALDPGHAPARFNLGYLLLRQGRMAEGLLCLEARPAAAALHASLDAPRWAGADLAGQRLLVISDAGHGDLIQMARYARVLKARGAARLILVCQPALRRLLAQGSGFDVVLDFDMPLPRADWDLWAPAMSLPFLCETRLDSIPGGLPYLHADPARTAHWRRLLQRGEAPGTLRVGLVWRGNPRHENDAERSLPGLHLLAPLAGLPGARFLSLQCGAGADEAGAPPPGLKLETLPEPLGDFAETAAIVANLDLVIGVDTSAVHLAAALGTPAWVLLPEHKTDWRWLDARSDTPWYPRVMRLFRQTRPGDWGPAVAEIAAAWSTWAPGQPAADPRERQTRAPDAALAPSS
jgi:Flp pilus assembly protein TadD